MTGGSTSKIAIIGAGSVGATIAYACLIRGVGREIVLYDTNKAKVEAETLDLNHGLQFVPMATVDGSDDVGVCAGAHIVVITAGAKQKPGQTRMDLAGANAGILRQMIPPLLKAAPDAVLVLVTNPVDVMTYVAQKLTGLPPRRVFGSGTVLDSSRFRFLIAKRLKVAVQSVHAHIVGEHGDTETPLWSTASIANVPLSQWAVPTHGSLSVRDRTEIFQNVKDAAYQIINGKGATNYAIGLSTAKILEAVLNNENHVLPVSGLLSNYRPLGKQESEPIDDVCLSLPSIVNRTGAEPPLPIRMNDAEEAGLRNSAEGIRRTIRDLGF